MPTGRRPAALVALVTLVVGGGLLAGCDDAEPPAAAPVVLVDNGVAGLAPAEILQRAKAALARAQSFRVRGSVPGRGQRIELDLKVRGAEVVGAMTWERAGARVDVLRVGGQRYVRPDERFLAMTEVGSAGAANVSRALAGRWARVPDGGDEFAELFRVADADALLAVGGTLTKGAAKEIAGRKAIGLVERGANGGTLYVATDGEPYPVRREGAGTVAFSDFGATFDELRAPAGAEAVDLAQLRP